MTPREQLLDAAVTWFAQHGIGETSLRTLAAGIGTSHRMLHYHFGSRAGLLAAVVEAVERTEQDALAELVATADDPWQAAGRFWTRVADRAETFAPLFFELSAQAMQRQSHADRLHFWLSTGWTDTLIDLFHHGGLGPAPARILALQSLAMARGLLFELALTGDRVAVDAAMARWTETVRREITGARSF